jgi:hypothetical protein
MMTPIHRIPMEGDSPSLAKMVEDETPGTYTAISQLTELIVHSQSDDHLTCALDWAMQIRSELGIDWGTAIRAAAVLYFG